MGDAREIHGRYTTLPMIGVIALFQVVPFGVIFTGVSVGLILGCLGALAVSGLVQYRLYRLGFRVSAEGLEVIRFTGRQVTSWDRVVGFAVPANGAGGVYVGVRLDDQSVITSQGMIARSREDAVTRVQEFDEAIQSVR